MRVHRTSSPQATARVAERLADTLQAGDVIALVGDLGAGKTCFVAGLARGLGIPKDEPITSPTFTVVNTYYSGRLPLFHFDLYRLEGIDDLEGVGFRDFVGGEGVAVLEWADKVPEALPVRHIRVEIEDGDRDDRRVIRIRRMGEVPSTT